MRVGHAASTRVSGRTPLAPLPASGPKRLGSFNGKTSAEHETSLPKVCSFQLPLTPLLGVRKGSLNLVQRRPRGPAAVTLDLLRVALRLQQEDTAQGALRLDSGQTIPARAASWPELGEGLTEMLQPQSPEKRSVPVLGELVILKRRHPHEIVLRRKSDGPADDLCQHWLSSGDCNLQLKLTTSERASQLVRPPSFRSVRSRCGLRHLAPIEPCTNT